MKFFLLPLLYILLAVTLKAEATPSDLLIKALNNEVLDDAEQEALVKLTFHDATLLKNTLEKEMPDSLKTEVAQLLKKLADSNREDEGKNRLGASLGWFLKFQEESLSSLPILTMVHKNSPAEKVGMKLGDVIRSAAGVKLFSEESRNHFVTLIHIWPSSTPLELGLRRNKRQPELDERVTRDKQVRVKVILSKR